jgi:hypothetical protein
MKKELITFFIQKPYRLINDQHSRLTLSEDGLSLRGDLLVKCFEKPQNAVNGNGNDDRLLLFQCQFNTCALELPPNQPQLVFYKPEMDLAGLFLVIWNRLIIKCSKIVFEFFVLGFFKNKLYIILLLKS